jgi:hypothetical protein
MPESTWNSTLGRIDGKGHSMVWRLSIGPLLTSNRTYRLKPGPSGSTEFALDEVFRGLLVPLIAKIFPDFGRMFERTAADLKAAAEKQVAPLK